jgi:hypothetical protein
MAIAQADSSIGGSDENLTRHPVFWFDDGSVVVQVQDHVSRVPPADCDHIVVDLDRRVLAEDVEILLEHLYHVV